MDQTLSPPAPMEKASSLRSHRDRSPERDRLHVRFQERNSISTVEKHSSADAGHQTSEDENKQFSGSNPMLKNTKPYSLKIQRGNSDSESEKNLSAEEKSNRSNDSHPSDDHNAQAELQNRTLPRRPDSMNYNDEDVTEQDHTRISSNEEKHHGSASDTSATNDEDEAEDGEDTKNQEQRRESRRRRERAMDEIEVSSDEFNEKLVSLDENTRQYYHFFHVSFIDMNLPIY